MYDTEMNELKKKVDKMILPKSKEYQQGRADQKAYCETCVHKVTKADIDAIEATARADEREKIIELMPNCHNKESICELSLYECEDCMREHLNKIEEYINSHK